MGWKKVIVPDSPTEGHDYSEQGLCPHCAALINYYVYGWDTREYGSYDPVGDNWESGASGDSENYVYTCPECGAEADVSSDELIEAWKWQNWVKWAKEKHWILVDSTVTRVYFNKKGVRSHQPEKVDWKTTNILKNFPKRKEVKTNGDKTDLNKEVRNR